MQMQKQQIKKKKTTSMTLRSNVFSLSESKEELEYIAKKVEWSELLSQPR